MPDWAFYTAFLLAASFVTFNGLFMALAPAKHRRFLAWMSQADSWSQPVRGQRRNGLEIERRLAGVGLTGIGIFLALNAARNAIYGKGEPGSFPSPHGIGSTWFPLVVGVCLLASGVFITWRPQSVVQWSKRHQPIAVEIPDHTSVIWKRGVRLLGGVFILGGLYTLWVALRSSVS